jgi:hypothetical protein
MEVWFGEKAIGIDCGSGYVDGRLKCNILYLNSLEKSSAYCYTIVVI